MKKNFKGSRAVITAVVLAVLIAAVAVVIISADEAVTFRGVQVTTDGKVNMIFWYQVSDPEDVKTANVVIKDGYSEDRTETVDLVYDETKGLYYARVRLAAAEMGYDVTVTPMKSSGVAACGEKTYSVRDYAELLFQSNNVSDKDVSTMKAILTYGQYATNYFKANGTPIINTVEVNGGLYKRDTNPLTGMAKKLADVSDANRPTATVVEGYESLISDPKIEIVLEDSVEVRLSYVWNGTTEAHSGKLGDDGRWYVAGNYISTTGFAKDISTSLVVNVNGVKAVNVTNASVLNCLSVLKASAATKDLAVAMYNYYYWTATEVPTTSACAHGAYHYEAVTVGATSSKATCTYCGLNTSIEISDDINYFSAPGQQLNQYMANPQGNADAGYVGEYMCETDGTTGENIAFNRVTIGTTGAFLFGNGTGEGKALELSNTIMGGTGRYAVFKIRFVENTASQLYFGIYDGTTSLKIAQTDSWFKADGNARGIDRYGITSWGWTTYVVDLTGVNNVNFTPENLDATHIDVGLRVMDGRVATIDVAYFAICDNWAEVDSLTGDDSVRYNPNWNTAGEKILSAAQVDAKVAEEAAQ